MKICRCGNSALAAVVAASATVAVFFKNSFQRVLLLQLVWAAVSEKMKLPYVGNTVYLTTFPPCRPVFHGWSPGVVRFPEDDEFDQMMQRAGSGRSKKTSSVSSNDDVFRGSGRDAFRDELVSGPLVKFHPYFIIFVTNCIFPRIA